MGVGAGPGLSESARAHRCEGAGLGRAIPPSRGQVRAGSELAQRHQPDHSWQVTRGQSWPVRDEGSPDNPCISVAPSAMRDALDNQGLEAEVRIGLVTAASMQLRITFGWGGLREKLIAVDHQLDDVALELVKLAIVRNSA